MKVCVTVRLKPGVLDPQGKAIESSLGNLGHAGLSDLRQSKLFEFDLDTSDKDQARAQAEKMAQDLLANTVIENYQIEVG